MTFIMVDIESDGPIPGDYSMVSLGAVIVDEQLDKTFYGKLKPISERFVPEALAISGHSRSETMNFDEPTEVMLQFEQWIKANTQGRVTFVSDNNGFDWMFVCWYFHHFLGRNPFGFSSQNLGSLYKGMVKNMSYNFRHLCKTAHTHHPVDDAIGHAEAMLTMREKYGLRW